MEILNVTGLGGNCKIRDLRKLDLVIVHRIDVGDCAGGVYKFFKEHREYSGGKMPYHFIIHKDGTIEQAISLRRVGFAALMANFRGIQIGCLGDFTQYPLTEAQRKSLLKVCIDLSNWIGRIVVYGHDEVPNSRRDTTKACPGHFVYMDNIRDEIKQSFKPFSLEEKHECLLKLGYSIDD